MDAPARIIDANANRCREGLRTLEDVARFALNDPDLTGELKAIRHALGAALAALPLSPAALLAARDTPEDVGTALTAPGERDRAGLAGVAGAGASRAGEALRVIEETAKALGCPGSAFEVLRYRLYEAHKRAASALLARAPQWRLCVLLTADLCAGRPPEAVARAAIEGGADCLQIREKAMPARRMLDLARRVIAIARPVGVPVIINDRADIALACGADGVHLGQDDLSVAQARRVLGPGAIVGVSTSNIEQAVAAVADGASYCGCGSMFASGTKPKPDLAGPAYLRAYLADERTCGTPHLAIGGITPANAPELAAAGCRGVAVSAAVCSSPDPAGACRALLSALSG